ncbi:MAG TPA: peptidoglycan DD-metalloendopeptidase family protein [Burkholderiales bacterium]|nr:peptidoglycan DD-metalloendopeptidase family protein [Burkholderiales bacterium]
MFEPIVASRRPACAYAAALLFAALLGGPGPAWSQAAHKKEKELEAVRSRIEALQKDLEKSEESRTEAADALRDSERAISQTNRSLFELSGQRRIVNAELRRLQQQAGTLDARIETQQTALAKLLYRQYVNGQPEALRLMLSRQDPNETARQLQYLGYISRARAEIIANLRHNVRELRDIGRQKQKKSAELRRLEAEEASQKVRLEQEKAAHKQVYDRISSDISRQRKQISTLKRDEARLTRLIERLARESAQRKPGSHLSNLALPDPSANGSAFARLRGRLRLPVIGELTNRFGSPREGGGLSWRGLFIAARSGQEVKAIAPGRVVYADWLRGFGNLMIIDHGEGYMSLYGNNESLLKQVGDEARAGDTIASVGNSGGNPDSGLYFELRYQGRPFDPLPWVRLK